MRKLLTIASTLFLITGFLPIAYSQPDVPVKSCTNKTESLNGSVTEEAEKYNELKKFFIEKNGDLRIRDFQISGLKKTEKSVVLEMTDVKTGDKLSSFNADNLVQELRKTGIIKNVSIDYINSGNSVLISINISEKITLIPIPMVSSNSSSISAGLFLLESNLLGLNKKLFLGGLFGNAGWLAMIGYTDPAFLDSNFTGGLYFNTAHKKREDADISGDVYRKYNITSSVSRISGGYRFTKKFTFLLTSTFYYADVKDDDNLSRDFTGTSKSVNPGIQLKYNGMHYTGLFKYGLSMMTDFEYGFMNEDRYYKLQGKAEYSKKLFRKHLLTFRLNGGTANEPDVFMERIGGRSGFKTLPPEKVISNRYISGTAAYELPVLKISWVTFTLVTFFESGTCMNENDSFKKFYGPGAGMRMYLKNIAIPAMGFDYAHNLETHGNEISAAVGMSM